ncbi:hypothetical protein HPB48_015215 [Haemaphysalis longicornis]|uniref:Uncharacterized protein n=1 Tax=Haemaphysalis longicornis TaxID=44386 RepID=A0A9J6F9B2_HAELO|nr:hypothetical protein HPB48_015215 [Haemaphysalis longicornis]
MPASRAIQVDRALLSRAVSERAPGCPSLISCIYLPLTDRRATLAAPLAGQRGRENVQLGSQLRRRRPKGPARSYRVTGRLKTAQESADTVPLCSRLDHAVPRLEALGAGTSACSGDERPQASWQTKADDAPAKRLRSGWRPGRREAPVQELNQFWPGRHSAAPSAAFCSPRDQQCARMPCGEPSFRAARPTKPANPG